MTLSPQTLVDEATHYLRNHLLNHAEVRARQLLAAEPGNSQGQRLLGIALYKMGRRDEGAELLAAGAEKQADNPRAWADLAVAWRDLGREDAARQAYARAVAAQAGAQPPPLTELTFCTDQGRHDFRIVDYDYTATVRYGAGRPPHPELAEIIGAPRQAYRAFLAELGELQADFATIPLHGTYEDEGPFWLNAWYSALDGMALTGMLKRHRPKRFVEVGSGVSTKFARRAVRLYDLPTRLTSIDPQPRNAVDRLCDEVIRKPLEQCDLGVFQTLEPGDIAFLDSSHRAFQGSDVTVFFLEVLPRLASGVIVHIHDIYLPYDYISGHLGRLWNEQYLLASALLFGAERFEILFPAWFIGRDPELAGAAAAALKRGPLANLDLYGAGFWMRTR